MLDLVTLTLRVVNVDRPLLLTLTPAVGTGNRGGNYLRYASERIKQFKLFLLRLHMVCGHCPPSPFNVGI
jgi:hypothetical protein